MTLFFLIFFIISALLATYISWRVFSNTAVRRIWKIAIALGIVGTLFLPVIMIILRRTGIDNSLIDALVWSGYLGVGFLSFVFTYLAIRDVLWLPAAAFNKIKTRISKSTQKQAASNPIQNPSRRGFLVKSMNYGIVATAALSTGYGIAEAKQTPAVKEVRVPLTNLRGNFEGFRIVQLTDIHISPTFRRASVEEIVKVVNTLNADIVALTGDLVDGTVDQLADDVAPLGKIQSAMGNYFVTGNHEYYSGVIEWVAEVRRLGFTVLLNEHRIITSGSGKLLLAGVTDYREGRMLPGHRSDPQKALNAAPETDIKILLAHQPKSIFAASRAGYDLQISGHTHGGQFFPWNLVVGFTQPYISGLYKHADTQIYVSRGTGYWGPPVRVVRNYPDQIGFRWQISGRIAT
jgi:predicted MPP superfamily phosphohydrolase